MCDNYVISDWIVERFLFSLVEKFKNEPIATSCPIIQIILRCNTPNGWSINDSLITRERGLLCIYKTHRKREIERETEEDRERERERKRERERGRERKLHFSAYIQHRSILNIFLVIGVYVCERERERWLRKGDKREREGERERKRERGRDREKIRELKERE